MRLLKKPTLFITANVEMGCFWLNNHLKWLYWEHSVSSAIEHPLLPGCPRTERSLSPATLYTHQRGPLGAPQWTTIPRLATSRDGKRVGSRLRGGEPAHEPLAGCFPAGMWVLPSPAALWSSRLLHTAQGSCLPPEPPPWHPTLPRQQGVSSLPRPPSGSPWAQPSWGCVGRVLHWPRGRGQGAGAAAEPPGPGEGSF